MRQAWHANKLNEKLFFTLRTKHFHSWFATDEDSDETSINYENRHDHHQKQKHKKRKKKHKKPKRKYKIRKKYKKFLMPLLIAYKLKFFALVPVFIGKMIFAIKLKLLKFFVGVVLSLIKIIHEMLHRVSRRKKRRKKIRRVYRGGAQHGLHILSHVTH